MGDEILLKSKQLFSDINERRKKKIQAIDVPVCLEDKLQSLLEQKRCVERDQISYHQQQMILRELELPMEQMITSGKIAEELKEPEEILSEATALHEQNVRKIEDTKKVLLEALDHLNVSLQELSEKITSLENKYAGFVEVSEGTESFRKNKMNPTCLERAKERVLLVLKNAEEEKCLIQERASRLESLCQLVDRASVCVESETESRMKLDVVRQRLAGLELLSGIKSTIIDDQNVVVSFVDPDSQKLPESSKLVITISFEKDDNQFLVLSNVETNIHFSEVETVIQEAKDDKDLPKLIRKLKKAWLSYVPLVTEVSSLRESHAIDWRREDRTLHLMIGKGVVCRLSIPPFYPHGEESISLDQIMGEYDTTPEKLIPPEDKSITGWVTHLETIFGKS